MRYRFLLCLLSFFAIACKTKPLQSPPQVKPNALLFNTWVNENEKDTFNTIHYRPTQFSLPRSRGRQSMRFDQDGVVVSQDIAPACGFETNTGKWKMLPNGQIELRFPQKPSKNDTIAIISITKDLLIIKTNP
jgi:hypothetical protein